MQSIYGAKNNTQYSYDMHTGKALKVYKTSSEVEDRKC